MATVGCGISHKDTKHTDECRVMKPRRVKWAGHVSRMGEMRHAYNILVVKLEGKSPLRRPRHR
jgi:hypothetical protein